MLCARRPSFVVFIGAFRPGVLAKEREVDHQVAVHRRAVDHSLHRGGTILPLRGDMSQRKKTNRLPSVSWRVKSHNV